ncbi:MAG: hypothetical protein K5761_04330, partial [Clostridiales bacterium]|nr:hypothetical protein [Clostridiales bacterium]
FMYFMKLDKSLLKVMPNFMELFIKYKMRRVTIQEVLDNYGLFLKEYCIKFENILDDFERFWDKNEKKIKQLYYDIRQPDDVIISACPECLLSIICDRMGIKEYMGSDVNPLTGEIHMINYHDEKVKNFREKYGDIIIEDFYTDSFSDKPMMDISKNVYLVKGNKIKQIKKDGVEIKA